MKYVIKYVKVFEVSPWVNDSLLRFGNGLFSKGHRHWRLCAQCGDVGRPQHFEEVEPS